MVYGNDRWIFFSPLEDLTFGVKPLIRVIFNKFDLVIQVFF